MRVAPIPMQKQIDIDDTQLVVIYAMDADVDATIHEALSYYFKILYSRSNSTVLKVCEFDDCDNIMPAYRSRSTQARKYCSDTCRQLAHAQRRSARRQALRRRVKCIVCGNYYIQNRSHQRMCSDICRLERRRTQSLEMYYRRKHK